MIDHPPKPRQTQKDKTPDDWQFTVKYDGTRQFLIIEDGQARLLNKRGKEKTRHFPEITEDINLPDGTVIDGELTIIDDQHPHGNLALTQKRDGGKPVLRRDGSRNFKRNLLRKKYPATFVGFDLLMLSEENYKNTAQRQRYNKLTEILEPLTEHVMPARDFTDIDTAWEWVKENNAEGLVAKHPEKQYPEGRTGKWKKIKNTSDTVVTATGFEEHSRGITVEAPSNGDEPHRINVNGWRSNEVKEAIEEEGEADIEITYLEKSDGDRFREPRFKRMVD